MSLTWVDDLPADAPPPGRTPFAHQSFYDDPRFIKDWQEDEHLYGDIVPIPFFSDDLPTLKTSDFGWTPTELQDAVNRARAKLFPTPP